MPFDGFTMAAMVREIDAGLSGGRINKIAQPEPDELIITARGNNKNQRLLLSASASLPLLYFTETNKTSPLTAPNFCMLLRKHIGSAHILSVTQPSLERIAVIHMEHLNELGDLCQKKLIFELMGKHSNLIFCDEEDRILDSIKHVPSHISSVREVLPGRDYFIPQTQEKLDPFVMTEEQFEAIVCQKPMPIEKALYSSITGFSPVMASEICFRASIDGDRNAADLSGLERTHLYHTVRRLMEQVSEGDFSPHILYKGEEPVEFGVLPFQMYQGRYRVVPYDSVSSMLETYYAARSVYTRMRQKNADLRRVVQTALDRDRKKLILQEKQIHDTEKKDKYRIYGELINTYGYNVPEGASSFSAVNYYNGEEITIPLDPLLSPADNAKRYFDRYGKLKRTEEALAVQTAAVREEIDHLESISNALSIAANEADLSQIKDELAAYGFIHSHPDSKKGAKMQAKSRPLHYRSSDGFDIYVGKNNFQNDELTFRMGTGNDWWFHAKKMPGSHVLVKTADGELPDQTFEEAGRLAAYYSAGRGTPKVEIDYIQKKHVKKPAGARPGFVVYYTNYSLVASPDISGIEEV